MTEEQVGVRPDSIWEESRFGYVVRSSRERTFLVELEFVSLSKDGGVWFVDYWVPGETVEIRKISTKAATVVGGRK